MSFPVLVFPPSPQVLATVAAVSRDKGCCAGLEIDEALRSYLSQVWLHGETQKIERILEVFAQHYYIQNPSVYRCMEAARTMSFSLIMLNMNLHNPKVRSEKCCTLSLIMLHINLFNPEGVLTSLVHCFPGCAHCDSAQSQAIDTRAAHQQCWCNGSRGTPI